MYYKKKEIIDKFNLDVKGKIIDMSTYNSAHCGKEGHWLEKQMGIKHNSKNLPDLHGYEMKKYSKKISFGDFSASEYLFSKNRKKINEINKWQECVNIMSRTEFIKTFGYQNIKKNNRYSWSGKCVPKYNIWNICGQILKISDNNSICIYYSFSKDMRDIKYNFHDYLKFDDILIAIWENTKLEEHINKKFNNKGFFICKKENNVYNKICFGNPFNYNYFLSNIKNGNIIFDSGMYEGNTRNYSQFRSKNDNFWNDLITEEYS